MLATIATERLRQYRAVWRAREGDIEEVEWRGRWDVGREELGIDRRNWKMLVDLAVLGVKGDEGRGGGGGGSFKIYSLSSPINLILVLKVSRDSGRSFLYMF